MGLIAPNPLILHFAVKWRERERERERDREKSKISTY